MEKVCTRISEMSNRCKLVVESSGRARYSNIEEEIGYFGVSPEYAPVPSIQTPPGVCTCSAQWGNGRKLVRSRIFNKAAVACCLLNV